MPVERFGERVGKYQIRIASRYSAAKSMGSGEPSIGWRSKLLTTRHPGMDSFLDACTMQSLHSA